MNKRKLGKDLTVAPIGLGCMGMSHAYGGQDEADSIKTLERAVELGVTLFDTAEIYGPFTNEILVGKALKPFRDHIKIATKFGFHIPEPGESESTGSGINGRPEHLKKVAEASLKRLGVEVIDLFYQHRVDPDVPIEETVGAMGDLVRQGKILALGLSEPSAETIRRAHAEYRISAVQSEYSLWTRDPEEEVLPTCKELGIGFVPFSPLGRGMLTGALKSTSDLAEKDFRRDLPRFSEENIAANAKLVDALDGIARDKGISKAQLALAWVLHQGDFIVPIPGARKINHLEDNVGAAAVELSKDDLGEIAEALPVNKVLGARYSEKAMSQVNK